MDATGTSVADWQKMANNLTGNGFAILDTSTFSENGPSNQFEAMGLGSDIVLGTIAMNAGATPDSLQDSIRQIKASISDVSNPDLIARANDPDSPDTDARDRIRKGRAYIKQAGNVFSATYESEISRKEREEKIELHVEAINEFNEKLAKGYKSTADSLNALLGETGTQYAGDGLERNKVLEARSTAMNYIESVIFDKGGVPSTSLSDKEMREQLAGKGIKGTEAMTRKQMADKGPKYKLWVAVEHAPQPKGRWLEDDEKDEDKLTFDGNAYRPVIMAWLDSEVRKHLITDEKKRAKLLKAGLFSTGTSSSRASVEANKKIAQSEDQANLELEAREDMEAQDGQGDDYTSATTINTAEDNKRALDFIVPKENQNNNE